MDTFDVIYQRRAIKGFDAEHRKDPWPKPGQLSLDEVVIDNGFFE